jgi:hypothetical protein
MTQPTNTPITQPIDTPWREDYDFGVGVNPAGGASMELVVQHTPRDPVAPGGSLSFNVARIQTTSDLQDKLKISVEASGGCGLFGASARFDFARDCKVHNESLFMSVSALAENAFRSIDDAVLTDDAAALAADPQAFQERFGTAFVRGIGTGGLFTGVIRVDSSSKDDREGLAGEISASYAAFELKISAEHDTESSSSQTTFTAMLYFEGGDRAAILNVFDEKDPRTLFAAAKIWASTVGTYGVPHRVTLAPTSIARGAPKPPNAAQIQLAQDILEQCARQRASLLDGLNRIEYLLDHEAEYGFNPKTITPQELQALATTFSDALTAVEKCASVAMTDPSNAKMPEGMPGLPGNMPIMDPSLHDAYAAKGRTIADSNPLVAALRAGEPDGPQRIGFDIGMALWDGNTADGPGKTSYKQALPSVERMGFEDAAAFSFAWNNNTELAAKGAAIAAKDPEVAAARDAGIGPPPLTLAAALYWLGFDIATALFGDPAVGGAGNTLLGPGSEAIRATLGINGPKGFNDSLKFNAGRRR